jgi:hypothetical protein
MEILQIPSSEAENVFDFFAERDRSSNIFKRGLDNLVLDYDSGKYFSFIASEKEKILGHGGIYKKEDLCVLENLFVDSKERRKGIAKKLTTLRLDFCDSKLNPNFLAVYVNLNRNYLQKLYWNQFISCGVAPNFKQMASKGELVLIKRVKGCHSLKIPSIGIFDPLIKKIYQRININVDILGLPEKSNLKYSSKKLVEINLNPFQRDKGIDIVNSSPENYLFLGILPSHVNGIQNIGFLNVSEKNFLQKNKIIGNQSRIDLINKILEKIN